MNLTTMTHVAVDGVMQGTAARRTRTPLELVDSRVDSKGVTIQRYRPHYAPAAVDEGDHDARTSR